MADAGGSIFNEKAPKKLRSPDDLDKCLQVTNPSVWAALAACLALLLGLLVWGVFGSVTSRLSTTGVRGEDATMWFLTVEDAAKVDKGDEAFVGCERMTVATVSSIPYSRAELADALGSDYLVNALTDNDDWAFVVAFDGDSSELPEGVPLTVTITTERIAPIRVILGGEK
jgi:hypothetical protein